MKQKILFLALCLLAAGCGTSNSKDANAQGIVLSSVPIALEETSLQGGGGSAEDQPSHDISQEEFSSDKSMIREEENLPSMNKLLTTALLPLGATAYVWGGGWNEEDNGAGIEARTLGVSPAWKTFADAITSKYDHSKYRYQIHDGLDCSGYVGWLVYNVFETENEKEGYVYSSTDVAKTYASLGFGEYRPAKEVTEWKPGDVASMSGHVWICLGTCQDGSVLLIHSSPPGVRICGTLKGTKETDASRLAAEIMKRNYPAWYERFPDCTAKPEYLKASQMRWNEETFPDAERFQAMSAEEIAAWLFPSAH